LGERAKNYWIENTYLYIWENLNGCSICIESELAGYKNSPEHDETLLKPTCNYFWGGIVCTNITNTTGKIIFVWNHAYTECTEEIRCNWCRLIAEKKE
jgi:hypothetical protein